MRTYCKKWISSFLVIMMVMSLFVGSPQTVYASEVTTLADVGSGECVKFGGMTWLMLDNTTGYVVAKDSIGDMAWDTGASRPLWSASSLAAYLNETFYDSLPHNTWITPYTWNVGDGSNEAATTWSGNVGLVSHSEFGSVGDTWSLTAYEWNVTDVYCMSGGSDSTGLYTYTNPVRPAIHLDNTRPVYGGTGTPADPYLLELEIIYVDNGSDSGSVPIDGNLYLLGEPAELVGNTGNLEKSGFAFAGWNTEADGSGSSYTGTETYTMAAPGLTLYAQWGVVPDFATGSGTQLDPWIITTPDELDKVRNYLGDANADKYFKLGNDIDMDVSPYNEDSGWEPIGSDNGDPFEGHFDGAGYTISNLFIDLPQDDVGLFGYLRHASISNVTLTDVNIIGWNRVGGLVGHADYITPSYAGSTITNCGTTGVVSGRNDVGGLVGVNNLSTITKSYSTCTVTGTLEDIGGLAGCNNGGSTIDNCYAVGAVDGDTYVGGLVGYNDPGEGTPGHIDHSYAAGKVTGANNVSGLVGYNGGDVSHSLYDYYTTEANGSNGSARLETDRMKQETANTSTDYDTWDFATIWKIDAGISYPYLQWQTSGRTDYAPPIGTPTLNSTTSTTVKVNLIADETCTAYYVVLPSGASEPTVEQVKAGEDASDTALAANLKGSTSAGTTSTSFTASSLQASTGYDIYLVFEDSLGNMFRFIGPKITATTTATPVSSGGGGGGSSTPAPANTGVDVLVNGKAENAGTATQGTVGNQTVTNVVVDEKKLEQKMESEGNNAIITIPINTKTDIVVGELNGQMVKDMETKQDTLELRTADASYFLPAQQIDMDAVSAQVGQDVALKDIKIQVTIAKSTTDTVKVVEDSAQKGNFTIQIPPMDFSVKATYGGKTVDVSKFDVYVKRLVAIPDGVDPSKITTGVITEADGTSRHVPTEVVKIDGKYYAKVNSLTNSTYSVVWHPLEFKDVANHWAKAVVNDMGSRMVISGVGNGLYEPDRDITRAEFAAIIVRALGLKPGDGSNSFTDVASNQWYCDYIKTATTYKIIAGYGDGKFGPNDKITREQAMTMISRAMEITGLKASLSTEDVDKLLAGFTDGKDAAGYAKTGIAACVKTGVVSGRGDGVVAPKAYITRAEVAAIVSRLLQKSGLI